MTYLIYHDNFLILIQTTSHNIHPIYLSISYDHHLLIHPLIYLYSHQSIHPSIYLYSHQSIHPSIYLSILPSIYPSIHLSILPSIYLSIYLTRKAVKEVKKQKLFMILKLVSVKSYYFRIVVLNDFF